MSVNLVGRVTELTRVKQGNWDSADNYGKQQLCPNNFMFNGVPHDQPKVGGYRLSSSVLTKAPIIAMERGNPGSQMCHSERSFSEIYPARISDGTK
jgi:hypothetical protein